MSKKGSIKVAIVDYYAGNLFSVKQACEYVGMEAWVTSSRSQLFEADVVILPGVGAFGDAMNALKKLDLVSPLKEIAVSNQMLVGICLGMQLLMTESYEFGTHRGLDIIPGEVIRFEKPKTGSLNFKVPQVGWNRISLPQNRDWLNSPLETLNPEEFMYFVHSFYVCPEDERVILSQSDYANIRFCSSLKYQNLVAFQFHPERSGKRGLEIYQALKSSIEKQR